MVARISFQALMVLAALSTVAFAKQRPIQSQAGLVAQALPTRNATIVTILPRVTATFNYSTALAPSHAKWLASGLPVLVSMRAYVFQDGNSSPIALTIKTCKIVYDISDEVYRLSISQSGAASRDARAPNLDGVLRRCGRVTDFGLVDRGMLQPGVSYYVAVVVDVDPISRRFRQSLDRWIANPIGTMIPFDATINGLSQMAFRTASFIP